MIEPKDHVTTKAFYDELASLYHLIYENWDASIERQGNALHSIIESTLGNGSKDVLDAACGIGTQSLGLAALGHQVTGSDLSSAAIERARREAAARELSIDFRVSDMRTPNAPGRFDVVLCADNSLPHLLSDEDITDALRKFFFELRPGGLCLISIRDYAKVERGGTQTHPYGVRHENGTRWILSQVWRWRGSIYDLDFYFVSDDGKNPCEAHVFRTAYYAISIDDLMKLMQRVGFEQIHRIEDAFFQPVISARKPR